MKSIAIIPARIGSKSIPKKNIKLLKGKPLIAYPIMLAKSIKEIDRVVVSTDSLEISKIAKEYGAEVPFIRPKELSEDSTPVLPVLRHCIEYLEKTENYKPDKIILLFPTNPFLKKEAVTKAMHILKEHSSVVSVTEDYGRYWKYDKNDNAYRVFYPKERVNRQYFKPLYKENGAIYFNDYKTIMLKNKIVDENDVGFLIMKDELIDIDTPEDWERANDINID